MSRSLTFCLETKMPWHQTPSRKKKAVVFTNVTMSAYQDQLNSGFSKVCEVFKVRGIESLKYIREFHTRSVIVVTFPRTETWRWTKRTVIGCLTCRSKGLIGGLPSIPDLQPSVWRCGYARLPARWLRVASSASFCARDAHKRFVPLWIWSLLYHNTFAQ